MLFVDCLREVESKRVHDPFDETMKKNGRCVLVQSLIIVGAGPSGLAVAPCLKEKGVPSVIVERANCIASLWKSKAYDRLHFHLPKKFCELPLMPFPAKFPTYPTKEHFVDYLDAYYEISYLSRWLVVATGENSEAVVSAIEGMNDFEGPVLHTSSYKNGEEFSGKNVLVVGCGNSGNNLWDGTLSPNDFNISARSLCEKWKVIYPVFPPWAWVPCPRPFGAASHQVEVRASSGEIDNGSSSKEEATCPTEEEAVDDATLVYLSIPL
ncbi:hypothetical protein IFM89_035026 [Coptis chinensis]|uniref:Flavin-containing monooxygenase n=1 Tax=Coptis chinensis TaxID=261450 RepID=A0A835LHE9_9MAGN|nr:hypothetical protein IFM89_035026 [Coptis chinensis]